MKPLIYRTLAILFSACYTAASYGGSTSTSIALSGTFGAGCGLTVPGTVDFGTQNNGIALTQAFNATINCTSGLAYQISAPANTPVSIGPDTNYISVMRGFSTNIATSSYAGTGNGANQSVPLTLYLHGPASEFDPIPATSVGSFSKTVTLTVTY